MYCSIVVSVTLFIFCCVQSVIEVDRRICINDIECGVEFNDISGNLHKLVDFEVEYLLKGVGFDGSVWIPDDSYPNAGYLLFTVFLPPQESGLYRFVEDGDDIYTEQLTFIVSALDVTWSSATPNYAYVASLFGQQVVVFNLETNSIEKTYDTFEGLKFSGPDGITSDENGNIYFTDIDLNILPTDPTQTRPGGGLFRIDALNDAIYLEGTVNYGYNGIALNNLYGNGKRLVTGNTVDLADDDYDLNNNDKWDPDRLFIAEYFRKTDGSLKDRGRYYSITEDIDLFPKKPYLDGMAFDYDDNLYVAVVTNQTMSKLSVINYNDCSDLTDGTTDYIGEIIFEDGFVIYAITLADDGYFYGSLVNSITFADGQFVRFKAKNHNKERHQKKEKHKKHRRDSNY